MLVLSETSWAISNMKCQATALVKNHMIPPSELDSKQQDIVQPGMVVLALNPSTQDAGTVDLRDSKASIVYKGEFCGSPSGLFVLPNSG